MKARVQPFATGRSNASLFAPENRADNPHRLIPIKGSKQPLLICSSSIAYARAEHVYVEINFGGNRSMLHRDSLAGLEELLPGEPFLRVHRSYVVNLRRVDGWRSDALFIGDKTIPISRKRRREVLARLQSI